MALDQTEHLLLEDFLKLFISRNLTVEEFLIGCQRYPDFYRRVEPFLATLPIVSQPEESRKILLEQVVAPFLDARQTPEHIRRQAPDKTIPLKEVIRRSEDLKTALGQTFASRLVDNFIAQSKLHIEKNQRDGLVRSIEPALDATAVQLIEHPRLHPGLALIIAGELVAQQPNLAPQKAAAAAMAHTLTLEVLAGGVDDPAGTGLRAFFQANATGVRQLIAPVGDLVFRMLPNQWRVEIIEDQIAKSFDRVAKKLESTGGAIADSPVFASCLARARQYQQSEQTALSGVAKLRNAVADVFTTVFGSPDQNIQAVYETGVRARPGLTTKEVVHEAETRPRLVFAVEQWEGLSLLAVHYAGLSQKAPNLFGLTLSVAGNWGLSYAAKKGAVAAGEKLAGTALGKVLGGMFGSAGGPVGAVVGSVVFDKALGFVGGIFGGIFSFFSGEFFARLFAGTKTKTDWKTDLPLLLAGGSVVAIVLLFVFPWFLNLQFMYDLAIKTPLMTSQENQPEGFRDFDQIYPPPGYVDFSALASKAFNCLSFGEGIYAGPGPSARLEEKEINRIENTINNYPQLKVLSCGLGCPDKKITITKFTNASSYGGFAPSARPGNVILYQHTFTRYADQTFAYLLAHELAHQLDWFNSPVAMGFEALGCGSVPPSTYLYAGNSAEAFAESAALYLIGHPEIKTYCGGKAFSYLNQEFSQCR